jgi:hypothetical protein
VPTALIVDDDLGFVYWLAVMFALSGCDVVPALSCEQAVSLVSIVDLEIDLIVVNPALSGVLDMIRTFSRPHRPKIVLIRDPGVETGMPFLADATLVRPEIGTSISRAEWAERIRMLLKELEGKPSSNEG